MLFQFFCFKKIIFTRQQNIFSKEGSDIFFFNLLVHFKSSFGSGKLVEDIFVFVFSADGLFGKWYKLRYLFKWPQSGGGGVGVLICKTCVKRSAFSGEPRKRKGKVPCHLVDKCLTESEARVVPLIIIALVIYFGRIPLKKLLRRMRKLGLNEA